MAADSPTPTSIEVDPLKDAILRRLRTTKRPHTTAYLRDLLKVRKATLLEALEAFRTRGLIERQEQGWVLTCSSEPVIELHHDMPTGKLPTSAPA